VKTWGQPLNKDKTDVWGNVMTRPLRIEYKGVSYHTTSLGNERRRICFAKLDYGRFKEKGRRYHCQFALIQGLTPFFFKRKRELFFLCKRSAKGDVLK